MKLAMCGKIREAADPAPYLRYSLNLPVATGIVGVDNLAQLEQNVAIVKAGLAPVDGEELTRLLDEARRITAHFAEGEWCWMPPHARG